jgi:hypothetical protein
VRRQQLSSELQQKLFGSNDDSVPAEQRAFVVDAIYLWQTPGEDKTQRSWRLVKAYPLQEF